MHCFYIETPADGIAALPKDEAKHAAKVLRLAPGDEVCAIDGAGARFRAEIASMDEAGVRVRLLEALPSGEPPVRVTVYQGVPKADKLDFIAQKLTELGVLAIVPVKMERCVVKLDQKDGRKRQERLARIAQEAVKQCRRAVSPEISEPLAWKQAIDRMAAHDLILIPWEDASGRRVKDAFAARPDARDIGIVIGPEGGMSEAEVAALVDVGALAVTLGPRILRTETASVVSAALAMQLWGDL